jgi:hypothetical protein
MAGQNNRSNFLFGLTLTELAFILFFILLFFSTLVVKEKEVSIEKIREEVEAYKNVFEAIPEFHEQSIEEKTEWLKELVEKDKLNVKHQELMEKHKALEDSFNDLAEVIPTIKDKSEIEKAEWLKELVEKSTLVAKNEALNKEFAKISEEIVKIEKELSGKKDLIARLEKKVKGLAGNRYPACWKDPQTKQPEYIYNIILGENGITTRRGYKKYLQKEFSGIPGSQNIIDTQNLTIGEFKQKTKSVFNWSVKTAKPECRHFVRIFDETKSKESYKKPLRGIEHYFFKKEYKTTYSEFQNKLVFPSGGKVGDTGKKVDFMSGTGQLKQFDKKDCAGDGRKSMPRQWQKICEGLDGDRYLKGKSRSRPTDSDKSNETHSSLLDELKKLSQTP